MTRVRDRAGLNQQWLSIGEACAYIGLSRSTLSRYETRGLLTDVRRTVGGHRRFSKRELDALMQGRRRC